MRAGRPRSERCNCNRKRLPAPIGHIVYVLNPCTEVLLDGWHRKGPDVPPFNPPNVRGLGGGRYTVQAESRLTVEWTRVPAALFHLLFFLINFVLFQQRALARNAG